MLEQLAVNLPLQGFWLPSWIRQRKEVVMLRKIFAVILALLALLFWFMTLTVPMVSAAAPALIALALTVAVYFVWPKHKNKVKSFDPVSGD
jgi:Flp pilus assembly protein TadB